ASTSARARPRRSRRRWCRWRRARRRRHVRWHLRATLHAARRAEIARPPGAEKRRPWRRRATLRNVTPYGGRAPEGPIRPLVRVRRGAPCVQRKGGALANTRKEGRIKKMNAVVPDVPKSPRARRLAGALLG